MRLRIILPLSILILATACESQNKKLIEIESELVQDQGSAQISVYNDDYMDHGKKKNYTYIDIIKDLMNNPDEYVRLHNEYDNSEYIDAYFRNSEGNVLSVVDMNLATFQYGENTNKTFTTFVRDTSGKKAGAYSGTAVFYIHCD